MIRVSFYDAATGRIRRRLTCRTEAEVALNLGPDEARIDGHHDWDTTYVVDAVPVPYPPRPGPWAVYDHAAHAWVDPRSAEELAADLEALRAAAIAEVNRASGAIRARYVTQIPGQEMLYLRKEAEARAWLADPFPDPAAYPLLVAEIGITAPTAHELAQLWLNLSALWVTVAAPLETVRLTGVAAIEAAAAPDDIEAARTATLLQIATLSGDLS